MHQNVDSTSLFVILHWNLEDTIRSTSPLLASLFTEKIGVTPLSIYTPLKKTIQLSSLRCVHETYMLSIFSPSHDAIVSKHICSYLLANQMWAHTKLMYVDTQALLTTCLKHAFYSNSSHPRSPTPVIVDTLTNFPVLDVLHDLCLHFSSLGRHADRSARTESTQVNFSHLS